MKEDLYKKDCIRTFTGKYVNVFEPTEDMICIEDIAHGLSNQCRFSGQLPKFYSVAQHSVYCAGLFILKAPNYLKFQALMHDASEAYLMDIPSPIKVRMPFYKEVENNLMKVIASKFCFDFPLNPCVKEADIKMLEYEWENLMLKPKVSRFHLILSPIEAKRRFLQEFNALKP